MIKTLFLSLRKIVSDRPRQMTGRAQNTAFGPGLVHQVPATNHGFFAVAATHNHLLFVERWAAHQTEIVREMGMER